MRPAYLRDTTRDTPVGSRTQNPSLEDLCDLHFTTRACGAVLEACQEGSKGGVYAGEKRNLSHRFFKSLS